MSSTFCGPATVRPIFCWIPRTSMEPKKPGCFFHCLFYNDPIFQNWIKGNIYLWFFGKKVFPPQGFMEKWLFSSSLVWSCLTCLLEQPSCDKERGIVAMFKIADVTIKKHLCHWWHFSVAETHSGTANCFQQQYLKL